MPVLAKSRLMWDFTVASLTCSLRGDLLLASPSAISCEHLDLAGGEAVGQLLLAGRRTGRRGCRGDPFQQPPLHRG